MLRSADTRATDCPKDEEGAMLKTAGLSLVAALGIIVPTVALAGVGGLDDPTGVLSASDNQAGQDNGAEVLQEEATPAPSPDTDDDEGAQQDDEDAQETPGASPEADDPEEPAEDQDDPGDVDDADDGEDADEDEDAAEDADEAGDVDDADEAEDGDGGAGAGTPPPGS